MSTAVGPAEAGPVTLEVFNPVGATEVGTIPAPRLDTLNGKRIGLMWQGHYRGDETFPYLQELLQKRFPGATIVPYQQVIEPTQAAIIAGAGKAAKAQGLDAVILGNGG